MPATPSATSVVPRRHARPNESRDDDADLDARELADARRGGARADASGSSGSKHERVRALRVRGVDAGRRADEAVTASRR